MIGKKGKKVELMKGIFLISHASTTSFAVFTSGVHERESAGTLKPQRAHALHDTDEGSDKPLIPRSVAQRRDSVAAAHLDTEGEK